MYKDLGIIDNWDWSINKYEDFIALNASSPNGINNGWYQADIGYEGTLIAERRMLADGNYDKHPETNRPSMTMMLAKIPKDETRSIKAVKVAFGLQ